MLKKVKEVIRPKSTVKAKPKQSTEEKSLGENKRSLQAAQVSDSGESYDEENQLVKVKIGKIPYGWYDQFKHFGYDNKLKPVPKKKQLDKIQEFIHKSENKDWWRTIRDQLNGVDIRLTDQQLELIDRIRGGKMASKTIANTDYSFRVENDDPFPLSAAPPAKRNFMPSKWEQMKVNKILDGLLSGRIKWNPDQGQQQQEKLYDAWASGSIAERGVINIAPMKQKLPDHNESYNPPKQYLLTPEQLKEWQQMDEEDRPYNFVPQSFDKMRYIPFYDKLIQEKFQRCLDLYLCPRIKKKKLNIDPDILIPKLPDPSTMKPFPVALNITYNGHNFPVVSLGVSPTGEYLATGDQNGSFIVWDVMTSRVLFRKEFPQEPIFSISWSTKNIILFSHGQKVELMIWRYGVDMRKLAELAFQEVDREGSTWNFHGTDTQQYREGFRVHLEFENDITHLQFHNKSDYFLTVCPNHTKKNQVILVHQLSKGSSQKPFDKAKGLVQKVYFHPRKPNLIIMTQSKVFIYNMQKLAMVKKLLSAADSYSCLTVHPYGDHIIVGSDDKKVIWYDLDLGQKPYKMLQYHERAVTGTDFHSEYPLMASCSNDGTIQIFHAKISGEDTIQDAIILPLKVLRGHTVKGLNGVSSIKFHPKQPWIFSVGMDHKVYLWT